MRSSRYCCWRWRCLDRIHLCCWTPIVISPLARSQQCHMRKVRGQLQVHKQEHASSQTTSPAKFDFEFVLIFKSIPFIDYGV